MKELQQLVGNFLVDRPRMAENNSDPEVMFKLLRDEVDEAEAEIDSDPETMARELADVVFFTMTLANQYGIDLGEAIREKTARNHVKYPAVMFQNGRSYTEAKRMARDQWKETGGDDQFYEPTQ